MTIRRLLPSEYEAAMSFIWEVFLEFGKPDYNEEGKATFQRFVSSPQLLEPLSIYGAFHQNELVGLIATKDKGSHISLFFVDKGFQGRGVGRQLFDKAHREFQASSISVDSSTYAVDVYRQFGFIVVGELQEKNGLKSIPMEYRVAK